MKASTHLLSQLGNIYDSAFVAASCDCANFTKWRLCVVLPIPALAGDSRGAAFLSGPELLGPASCGRERTRKSQLVSSFLLCPSTLTEGLLRAWLIGREMGTTA